MSVLFSKKTGLIQLFKHLGLNAPILQNIFSVAYKILQ